MIIFFNPGSPGGPWDPLASPGERVRGGGNGQVKRAWTRPIEGGSKGGGGDTSKRDTSKRDTSKTRD